MTQRIDIPSDLDGAVKSMSTKMAAAIRLHAFGGDFYALGRVLIIQHENGTVTPVQAVLPTHHGPISRDVPLQRFHLRKGDHYGVVTIHRSVAGVWFILQQAAGYTAHPTVQPIGRNHFPVISGHLDNNVRAGEGLLRALSNFAGIEFHLGEHALFREYRALPLGFFHDQYEQINEERMAARALLGDAVVDAADEHHQTITAVSGYSVDFQNHVATVEDPEQRDKVERMNAEYQRELVSSHAELAAATQPAPKRLPTWLQRPEMETTVERFVAAVPEGRRPAFVPRGAAPAAAPVATPAPAPAVRRPAFVRREVAG